MHIENGNVIEEALAAIASMTSLGKSSKNHAKFFNSGICGMNTDASVRYVLLFLIYE